MCVRRALGAALTITLAPCPAAAVQYEVFIDVETEEDLYDLLLTEQISEASFNALLLLHQTRIDLNRADRATLYLLPNLDYGQVDRILAYRAEAGAIRQLGDLTAAGVLEAELVVSLQSFVIVRRPETARSGATGFLRIQTRWSGRQDRLPPASAIQARVRAAGNLDSGVAATLTRNGLHRVRWDPTRAALSAEPESIRIAVPKMYVEWEDDRWELIAGTYRVGFGQRLTFDVTDQVTPNGFFGDYELRRDNELGLRCRRVAGELPISPCSSSRVVRVTPDFGWTNRLAGVATGVKDIRLGDGRLQVYLWGSYQFHRILQTEITDARRCVDPRQDEDPSCRAPLVYVRGADSEAPASAASFATLPAMYTEGLAGANATYFWNERAHLGVTGYGSKPRWLVQGTDLDFQEFSRRPFGGPFGAVGADAAFGFGVQDLFLEVARSFDTQTGGGGGYGAVVRSVTALPTMEIEASARYYDSSFANPYARPISAADELDGLRARDEAGLRLRATINPTSRLGVRTVLDGWRRLSSGAFAGLLFGRLDLRITSSWAWSIWTEYRNSGLQRFLLASRLSYEAGRIVRLSCQFQSRWIGGNVGGFRLQQDLGAILEATARPLDLLRLRVRARYDFEDIRDNHHLPQSLWTLIETAVSVRDEDVLRLRYDLRLFLDRRESTIARTPNPEHRLWVDYVFRY